MTVDNANRNIPVHISSRVNRLGHGHHSSQGSNAFNLKNVARQEPIAHTLKQLSSLLSTNVRSLLPKIDELVLLWSHNLNDDIDDDLVSIRGYNLFRKDRSYRRGGRVCVYLSQDIPVKRMIDLESHHFECVWLCLRPIPVSPDHFRVLRYALHTIHLDYPCKTIITLMNI